jgi:hypothetical protein
MSSDQFLPLRRDLFAAEVGQSRANPLEEPCPLAKNRSARRLWSVQSGQDPVLSTFEIDYGPFRSLELALAISHGLHDILQALLPGNQIFSTWMRPVDALKTLLVPLRTPIAELAKRPRWYLRQVSPCGGEFSQTCSLLGDRAEERFDLAGDPTVVDGHGPLTRQVQRGFLID